MRVRKLRTPSPVPTPKPAKGCERMQTVLPGLSHDAVGVRRVRELHLHSASAPVPTLRTLKPRVNCMVQMHRCRFFQDTPPPKAGDAGTCSNTKPE